MCYYICLIVVKRSIQNVAVFCISFNVVDTYIFKYHIEDIEGLNNDYCSTLCSIHIFAIYISVVL